MKIGSSLKRVLDGQKATIPLSRKKAFTQSCPSWFSGEVRAAIRNYNIYIKIKHMERENGK